MTRVFIDGVFDLYHPGHMESLRKVRKLFDYDIHLIAGISSDEDCISYKRLPVLTENERIAAVKASGLVEEVCIGPLFPTLEFMDGANIAYACHGDDFSEEKIEKYYGPIRDAGRLKIFPYTQGISTTMLIKAIMGGEKELESLYGDHYYIPVPPQVLIDRVVSRNYDI